MGKSIEHLRCKNCEGELDLSKAKDGVLTCPYCRTTVVLPRDDSSLAAKTFLRSGNQNLELGRFDEASVMFGKAIEENANEPEAYFGLALAKAKIQYLKDLINDRLQPICFEISNSKFTDDKNYIKAVELSNPTQKAIYEERGKEIDDIKGKFFELREKNIDYDTFICTKVTKEDGGNTQDSMNALKIFHELKDAGYKPFYSEEILKGFVGEDYEANILYALYSSGSMLIICSNEDYLQTKWVKNEYTRYISLLEENEKQKGSIAFIYNGNPIEQLPGVQGKIQGIDFSKFNALNQIMSFVEKYAGSNRLLDFHRKEYEKTSVQKKRTIKRDIKKRNLNIGVTETVSISDEAKLSNAKRLLEKGDFENVCNFCNEILMGNKFYGKAYWTLFLAENNCKSEEEFINSTAPVADFSNLEKAVSATSDTKERNKYYNTLKQRILKSCERNVFEEYIALPEVADKDLLSVVDCVYEKAEKEVDKELFDVLISVEKNVKKYINMNFGFLKNLPKEERKPYYENILSVDAANAEALYENFNLENNLMNDEDVLAFYSDKTNHETIETALFSYGYNKFAADELSRIAQNNGNSTQVGNIYDLILSMTPKTKNDAFSSYLKQAINKLFEGEKKNGQLHIDFEQLEKYNNALIAMDKYNYDCYVNRLLIENRIKNPLELLDCKSLYNYEDFRLAVNTYAEKYPNKPNYFMQFDDELKEIKTLLADKRVKQYVMDNYTPRMEWLGGKAREDIIEILDKKMHACMDNLLKKNNCEKTEDLYNLRKDITKDEDFIMAREISKVLQKDNTEFQPANDIINISNEDKTDEQGKDETSEEKQETGENENQEVKQINLAEELDNISNRQPQEAKKNNDVYEREQKKEKRTKEFRRIFWGLYAVGLVLSVIMIATLALSQYGSLSYWVKWQTGMGINNLILLTLIIYYIYTGAFALILFARRHVWYKKGFTGNKLIYITAALIPIILTAFCVFSSFVVLIGNIKIG